MQRNFATFQPNRLNCLSVLTIIMKNTEQTKCKMKQIIEINEDCGIDCSRVQTHNVIVFFSRLVHNLVALVPTACSYVQAHTQVFQFAIDDVSNNEMVSKTCEREETKTYRQKRMKTCWIANSMINEFPTETESNKHGRKMRRILWQTKE